MRVLHLYRSYFPDPEGGVQEAIHQISLATRPLGIENSVYCLSPKPLPQSLSRKDAETIWRSRSWAAPASCDLGGPDAWRLFKRLASEHDVIHYHFPWPFADLLHMTVRPKAPAVMTYHSDIVRQVALGTIYRPLMWRMLEDMGRIVATSPAYASTSPVLSDERVRDRVLVIPLGMTDLAAGNKESSVAFSEPYFLFLGALRYYKGLEFLVEAASRVRMKIVIAGDGPQRGALQQKAISLGATNVEFAGRVSHEEKLGLLAGCHGFVLPSHQRSEAFGMALVEAAMFSKPMISCEIGSGTSYVNAHMGTGLVVPPGDPARLADAMNALVDNPDLAQSLGHGARARYEQLFSASALGQAHLDLYRDAIA